MKTRIEIVFAAVVAALALSALSAFIDTRAQAAAAPPGCTTGIVASGAGPVCGTLATTTTGKQAQAFLGIPFAESTAGERRWEAPVPKPPWKDTFAALQFGAICPQSLPPPEPPPAAPPPSAPPPSAATQPQPPPAHGTRNLQALAANPAPAQPPVQSEDCLNLNIWAPAGTRLGAGLPVMVFIYGGAFEAGYSGYGLYDGAYLAANKNVILVSFNYRVGALGFLATDELSGNYGFLDQQLALSWVRRNIGGFGGDPDKVTIFGESAGAMSVGLHVFSAPGSAHLFRAAIMESNFFALPYKRLEDQKNVGNIFKQGLNCRDVKCLRRTSVDDLLAAQGAFTPQMSTVFSGTKYYIPFSPAIDGAVLTRQPVVAAAEGVANKPILMGTNKNEAILFTEGQPISPGNYSAWAASLFGSAFQKVIAKYPAHNDSNNEIVWANVQTDNFLICSTRYVAAHVSGRAYAYLFNHQPSFPVWGGALCRADDNVCHGDELPFVFHTADQIGGHFTAEEEKLSDAVMDYWTNFASTLDPNGISTATAMPRWPRFSAKAKDYLALNIPTTSVQTDPYRETCGFWDRIGYNLVEPWIGPPRN